MYYRREKEYCVRGVYGAEEEESRRRLEARADGGLRYFSGTRNCALRGSRVGGRGLLAPQFGVFVGVARWVAALWEGQGAVCVPNYIRGARNPADACTRLRKLPQLIAAVGPTFAPASEVRAAFEKIDWPGLEKEMVERAALGAAPAG